MSDLVVSQPPDKAIHEWAQSPVEALHVIENLTLDENALVVDCFLGSGAFGIAPDQLGRYFLGIEIDEEKFKLARDNMAAAREKRRRLSSRSCCCLPAPSAPAHAH